MANKYNDPRWQRLRLEVMQRDDFTCCKCGRSTETLNVHHKRYSGEIWESPQEDLQTLCESCHAALGPHPRGGIWWKKIGVSGETVLLLDHCPNCSRLDFTSRVGVCRCSSCGWDSSYQKHRVVSGLRARVEHKAPLFWGREIESFYLAGKITGTSWRGSIVAGWGSASSDKCRCPIANAYDSWDPLADAVTVAGGYPLTYVGPWWVDDSGGHGYSGQSERTHAAGGQGNRRRIASSIRSAIESADMVFAWVDSFDCYGTIWELGLAAGRGIPTVVAFKEGIESAIDELWLAIDTASVTVEARDPSEAWRLFWDEVSRGLHGQDMDPDSPLKWRARGFFAEVVELERLVAARRVSMGIKK